ncbi:MAG: competence/damage-inducible protein A [bacterium]|nr:competence/damage-inducible protein A [bacterium]MCP4965371.1 competence/damage-inducible protein A [bacterium]
MIVEAITVGTELLYGQTVNTNAATIGRRLADAGLDHQHSSVVGDDHGRMVDAIRLAMTRADALIITGGLGPTQDDITREAIAAATDRPIEFSDDYADRLRHWWERRGRAMPESNLKQAEYPQGADLLENPKGTAPGIRLEVGDTVIYAVPGVPVELEILLDMYVIGDLRDRSDSRVVLNRVLRTYGESESKIGELLADLYDDGNPSMAFLASAAEIKVRLTAKAATTEAAEAMVAPLQAAVEERLGSLVFGLDDETVETILLRLATARGWSIATAESATGGLVASRITAIPGASEVFRGSIVAYHEDIKRTQLGVDADLIAEHGVVSEPVAIAMADGVAAALGADVGVSVTGSAGPDPQERPVGTMVIGVHTPDKTMARTVSLPGDRERVRTYTTTGALHLARLAMSGEWWHGDSKRGRWV